MSASTAKISAKKTVTKLEATAEKPVTCANRPETSKATWERAVDSPMKAVIIGNTN
jgi:hypothetical protein